MHVDDIFHKSQCMVHVHMQWRSAVNLNWYNLFSRLTVVLSKFVQEVYLHPLRRTVQDGAKLLIIPFFKFYVPPLVNIHNSWPIFGHLCCFLCHPGQEDDWIETWDQNKNWAPVTKMILQFKAISALSLWNKFLK